MSTYMPEVELNGWNAARLNDLAQDVHEIKKTLMQMQSDETEALRSRVKDLEGRARVIALAVGGPILASIITVALTHVF